MKSILLILILSLLIVWGSGLISHPEPGCGQFPDAFCRQGWPLAFRGSGGIMGREVWWHLNFFIDLVFWFLVLISVKKLLKKTKRF